jgi:hypothetical protein
MKTCDTCLYRGACGTEEHARACMSEPHCGGYKGNEQMELELEDEC